MTPSSVALTSLTDEAREQALKRYHLIRPFLEAAVSLPTIAHDSGIPLRTLQRWVSRYKLEGLSGLSRKRRIDQGHSRFIQPEMTALIEGLALHKPPLSIAAIHRNLMQLSVQTQQPCPSYSTVYSLIKQMDAGLLTLAHEGVKTYSERFDLLYRNEATHSNTLWQADHTQLDICVVDEQGKPVRPWLTIILDDYSRAIAGYFLSVSAPSAWQTALTLHQAIWCKASPNWNICGIPDILYTDHGSDFTSQHLEQVCADLKIQLIFSQVGKPRGRGKIERFFQTVNQRLLCHLEGYTPRGSLKAQPTISLHTLKQHLEQFLQTYHQTPQTETGETPKTRWEAQGFTPRLPNSLEELDLLLLSVPKARRVHQDGIHFQGLRYIDPLLAAYVGEAIIIRYDPRDMAEIRVFYQDKFLCRAICQKLATESVTLKEIVAARNQRRQDLKQTIAARLSWVDALLKPTHPLEETPLTLPEPAVAKPKLKRYLSDE